MIQSKEVEASAKRHSHLVTSVFTAGRYCCVGSTSLAELPEEKQVILHP